MGTEDKLCAIVAQAKKIIEAADSMERIIEINKRLEELTDEAELKQFVIHRKMKKAGLND